jgi:hypothetical protein
MNTRATKAPDAAAPAVLLPPYAQESRLAHRLAHEAWDHLWPWSSDGLRTRALPLVLSLLLAVLVTLAWGAAAMGALSRGALIGWWFGWSVLEIGVRRACKPYMKEGPWWGSLWRRAGWMDLVCYVLFKNLLIGSVLFLSLKSLGMLAD